MIIYDEVWSTIRYRYYRYSYEGSLKAHTVDKDGSQWRTRNSHFITFHDRGVVRARVGNWAASKWSLFASHFVSCAATSTVHRGSFTDVSAVPSHGRRVHTEARARVVLAV